MAMRRVFHLSCALDVDAIFPHSLQACCPQEVVRMRPQLTTWQSCSRYPLGLLMMLHGMPVLVYAESGGLVGHTPAKAGERMTFSLAKDIGVPRAYFAVAMLNSGSVLLIGVADTHTFVNRSTASYPDLFARALHCIANAIGGHDGLEFLDSTEVLNINNMEVSGGPRLQVLLTHRFLENR
eukprot:1626120-Amphidinium_carterae.2